jgi:hypothetical protein
MRKPTVIVVAAAILGVAAFAPVASAHAAPTRVEAKSKCKKPKCYKVGQTAKSADFKFTVYSAVEGPAPGPFASKPGTHIVAVDVEVINPDSQQRAFSSLLGFHLLDRQKHQYNETLTAGLSPPAPDGQIPPEGSIRGMVGFEVPDGTTGLRFRAQGEITANGAIWMLT